MRPSSYQLFVAAFATILLTLLATGVAIRYEATRVHTQARQLVENGVPSVVAAARLKDVLVGFSAPGGSGSRVRTQRFQAVLDEQKRAVTFFPGEREQLVIVETLFHAFLANERQPRAGREAELARLVAECEKFDAINKAGMRQAQDVLARVAERADAVLLIGLWASAGLALGWALLLTGAIARPLARLRLAVTHLPETGTYAPPPPGWTTPREIEALGAALRDATGELADVRASLDAQVVTKTAALATANGRLGQLVHELEEEARSKSSFLAAVSHEFRTPIAVIKGGALTLADLGPQLPADAVSRLLGNIVEEADHLTTMVTDMLDAARMDARAFRISPEPDVDVARLVDGVVLGLATLYDEQEIALAAAVAPGLPSVTADADRLRQILRNLLENAAKFSQAGSRVTLTVAPGDGDTTAFAIADQGPGVPPDLAERLFRPFVRGAGAMGGTGLGLAIAKELVEAHGGTIGVTPNDAGGATFRFTIRNQINIA